MAESKSGTGNGLRLPVSDYIGEDKLRRAKEKANRVIAEQAANYPADPVNTCGPMCSMFHCACEEG